MIPSNISKEHVIRAIQYINEHEVPKGRRATKFWLLVEGREYPPKYVISLANLFANGVQLAPAALGGGSETNRFLAKLGFQIVEMPSPAQQTKADRPKEPPPTPAARHSSRRDPQKEALLQLLRQLFGHVEKEFTSDWLVVPDRESMDRELATIVHALTRHRSFADFFSPGEKLQIDFFIPSRKLVIEYDERQHFSIPRSIALLNYPGDVTLGFDKGAWIAACERIRASDRHPKDRDEQRAFYDSLRDILGSRNGMTVMRIKKGDCDWSSAGAAETLKGLLPISVESTHASVTDETKLDKVSRCYADLQVSYREWAKQFNTRDEAMGWLMERRIDTNRVRSQSTFNLLSWDWNSVTLHVLRKVAPAILQQMRQAVANCLEGRTGEDIDRMWYLLFFIHPVRHELWYFDGHYPDGYFFRLAKLLRSHRQGLKGAITHTNAKAAKTLDTPYLKACSTVAFKHIHLYPITNVWEVPGIDDLCHEIKGLRLCETALSPEEKSIAVALSRRANYGFDNWIRDYAPCAINEGPIFSLKQGRRLSGCLEEITEALSRETFDQDAFREILAAYHDVEV